MDPESGVSPAGSFIPLNEQEQRYYSALYGLCQADTPGKLASSKVAELFKASQLPPEALHKVTEVCGAKRLGYFGTPQFYVALKLLAAAQSGLPVCLESVTANLPFPIFVELKNEAELRYSTIPPGVDTQGIQSGSASGSVSRTPADRCSFKHLEANADQKISLQEPWSPAQSPCSSPPRSPLAYHSYPYTKPRNSFDSQTAYENIHSTRPAILLDKQSSPGKYGTKSAVENQAVAQGPSVERSNQQGTADNGDDEPWRITQEQREYYTNQFKTLQPDLEALILGDDSTLTTPMKDNKNHIRTLLDFYVLFPGAVAKNFFTKSKLPIPELSHIWELSDVDRDGALTFSEFCTAFHLIVARKNGYPLPEKLPPTLNPGFMQHEEDMTEVPERVEPLIVFEEAQRRPSQMDRNVIERLQPSFATVTQELKEETSKQDFFVTASTDSSVRKVGSSKEKNAFQLGAFSERPGPPHDLDPQLRTKTRPRSYSSTSIDDAMKKVEEPPTPPPRPQKTHSRASSLDLNKLLQQGTTPGIKSGWLLPPPALPPRPSTSQVSHFVTEKTPQNKVHQPNFADFSHFREEKESVVKVKDQGPHFRFGQSTEDLTNLPRQDITGASHGLVPQKPLRRKYHPESQNLETVPPSAMQFPLSTKASQKLLSRQKREIQMAIRKNRETNAVLTRLNSELQQQLKVIHQERVTLESQLELHRPMA